MIKLNKRCFGVFGRFVDGIIQTWPFIVLLLSLITALFVPLFIWLEWLKDANGLLLTYLLMAICFHVDWSYFDNCANN